MASIKAVVMQPFAGSGPVGGVVRLPELKAQSLRRVNKIFYDCADTDRNKVVARGEGFQKWPYSRVNPVWRGEKVLVVAGGPSVRPEIVAQCREGWRIIAVNNSYKLVPWADLLYFADARWWGWHGQSVQDFAGEIVTLKNHPVVASSKHHVHSLLVGAGSGLSLVPDTLHTGGNSTYQAINFAVLAGAKLIVTMGLDMQNMGGKSHWHGGHPCRVTPDRTLAQVMAPRFKTMLPTLERLGVKVLNASPGSLCTAFPIIEPEQALTL